MTTTALTKIPRNTETGVVGYAIAWLLGIPASILLIVFLLRGCD